MTTRKQQLLDAEDAAWRALAERLDRLTPADWERAGVSAEWSPKDVVAHVAAWHAVTTDRLEALRATGSLPGPPDVDAFNAEQVERCRELSLKEIRAMSGASRHRFREEIAALDEIDDRLTRVIRGNADEHYAEHLPDLDRFLGTPA